MIVLVSMYIVSQPTV